MPFEKGNRANPSGRPPKTPEQREFERKCREWANEFAIKKLMKAADSSKAMEVIAAVKEICDRGFGKAEQISYSDVNVTSEATPNSEAIVSRGEDLLRGSPEGDRSILQSVGVDTSK